MTTFNTQIQHPNSTPTKQVFVSEVKRHYNLKKPKGAKPTPVIFVVCVKGKQIRISTGVKVYPNQWTGERAKITNVSVLDKRNNIILNNILGIYDNKFEDYKEEVAQGLQSYDIQSIKNYMQMKKENILEQMRQANENAVVTERAKKNRAVSLNNFERYIKSEKIDLDNVSVFNLQLMQGFQEWCGKNLKFRKGSAPTPESINNNINNVNRIIQDAFVKTGKITRSDFVNMKVDALDKGGNDEVNITLLDDEILKIYNYKADNELDEKIKDLFVLQCLTGQRYIDMVKLKENVSVVNGKIICKFLPEKTQKPLTIDLIFKIAVDIFNKYEEIPNIHINIMNTHLPNICKNAGVGIDEKGNIIYETEYFKIYGKAKKEERKRERYNCVTTHTARHTFVSLMLLREWSATKIKRYTGHKEIRMIDYYERTSNGVEIQNRFEELKQKGLLLEMVGETNKVATVKPVEKRKPLDVLFADDKIKQFETSKANNYFDRALVAEIVAIIKKPVGGLHPVTVKQETKDRLKEINKVVWDIAKIDYDTELYRAFCNKLLQIGVTDCCMLIDGQILGANTLGYMMEQENKEEQETTILGDNFKY